MTKEDWQKRKAEKAREKAERKQAIKRANTPATGPSVGPSGFPLTESLCGYCGYPTTEVWVLMTGEVGCARCVEDPKDVLLARVHEARGDFVVAHTVTPSLR